MVTRLLHIVDRITWTVVPDDEDYRPAEYAEVGFIHLSTPELVLIPANAFYAGRDDLVLLDLDPEVLGDAVRFEPGVPPSGDLLFPHLYGPIPRAAVLGVIPFPRDRDGHFVLPRGL